MVRNEVRHLQRWATYYSGNFGAHNLYVLDHASDPALLDSYPDILPRGVNVIRLPFETFAGDLAAMSFDQARFALINKFKNTLRTFYDVVIYNDADEIFLPDPAVWASLSAYINAMTLDGTARAGMGLELFEDSDEDSPLMIDSPLFRERRNYVYMFKYCKPHITTVEGAITTHGVKQDITFDPDLYLLHLKFLETGYAAERQDFIRQQYEKGYGGRESRWRFRPSELLDEVRRLIGLTRTGGEFPHHTLLRNHSGRPGPYRIDGDPKTRRAGGGYTQEVLVSSALPWETMARLQRRRHKLPERFGDVPLFQS